VPGLLVAAPASGGGKTVATAGLCAALAADGLRIAPAKTGPDYIDPRFLAHAAGRPAVNLDTWAMRPAVVDGLLAGAAAGADLVVAEGVMGLFDGAPGAGAAGSGSTADLARRTGWPVVLVVDGTGQGASAAALVRGFRDHDPGVRLAGVIFTRVGGGAHAETLRQAVAALGVPVLGTLARDATLALPSRHLGLVPAAEQAGLEEALATAADRVREGVDLAAVRAAAGPDPAPAAPPAPLPPPGQRIAVADDAAFAFAYAHVLDGWRRAGAETVPFSPLNDEAPDADADAVYLPGGYPELHAGRLAANATFRAGLHAAARRGARVYGECGGYMALGEGLIDADGTHHRMAGLLPLTTSFARRRLHLGYRAARLTEDGTRVRGHEFHYATVVAEGPGEAFAEAWDARGNPRGFLGRRVGPVAGSFLHLMDRC